MLGYYIKHSFDLLFIELLNNKKKWLVEKWGFTFFFV